MRNKLRVIWHVLLGDSVMYRVTASRADKIAFSSQLDAPWWRLLFGGDTAAFVECDTWEDRNIAWFSDDACPHHYYGPGDGSCPYAHAQDHA